MRIKVLLAALAVSLAAISPASAVVIDPTTGGSGEFVWSAGLGSSVEWFSPSFTGFGLGDATLDITLGIAGFVEEEFEALRKASETAPRSGSSLA